MIAGPYRGGSSDKTIWKQNHDALNIAAYQVFQKGHIPVIGVNVALPIIETAGWEHFDELMMPISLAMADRCDAVLRIGGVSTGADQEVVQFITKDLPVYYSIEDVPVVKA